MEKLDKTGIYTLIENIKIACLEIQKVLHDYIDKNQGGPHAEAGRRDIVTLDNIIAITAALKEDVEKERVGACTELLLRIAAKEYKEKLDKIPEKKHLRRDITKSLQKIHRKILQATLLS